MKKLIKILCYFKNKDIKWTKKVVTTSFEIKK